MDEKYLLAVSEVSDTDPSDILLLADTFGREYISSIAAGSEKSRRDSLCGAQLLYRLCLEAGLSGYELTVVRNKWGKPRFANHPGISFSISHDKKIAACALSVHGDIGIDIMMLPARNSANVRIGIAERFMSEDETARLISAGEQEQTRGELFAEFWTRREAYSKLLGGPLSDALGIPLPEVFTFETKKAGIGQIGYVLSVCTRK